MPTIRDVAREAQVSIATVSRVLNKAAPVNDDTAARVRSAVAKLGFRPNHVGRSLKTASSRTLGVMIPSLANPVFADAVAGMTEAARAAGYALMFTATEYEAADEREGVATLLGRQVDGLILTVADPDASPALDVLDAENAPYVLVYNQPGARGRPTITVDNVAAGREVAERLIALGHRRLGMVAGHAHRSDRAKARAAGFIAGARAAGLAPPEIVEVDFVTLETQEALDRLFADAAAAPTALFCSNDLLAITTIGALSRIGLSVPEDVSVIGFDGMAVGAQMRPSLATVAQPSREMGRLAVQALLDRLAGGGPPETAILPHSLRLGGSAGPAGKHRPADPPRRPALTATPQANRRLHP